MIRDYICFIAQLVDGTRLKHERRIAQQRQHDIGRYLDSNNDIRVLDLGNGWLTPQYLILKSGGHQVYGIDLVNRPENTWINKGYHLARRILGRQIGSSCGAGDNHNLICGDVRHLPFETNSFDLVTSVAAFEHFLEIPTVVSEVHRVLRVGGLAWIRIHLFTSLSGAHDFKLCEFPLTKVPRGVKPWRHLRDNWITHKVTLNQWRRTDYLNAFAAQFEIIDEYSALREGESLLTPEIAAELHDYSRDELTCRSYVIIARKSGR